MLKSQLKSIMLAIGALAFAICLITMPTETLAASKRGVDIWSNTVFPSLLPFFITGEILIGFGVVHFIGVLFEPIMRPIFNVPGVGSFVWAMGMASGYPAGAKFTARMRQEGQLTQVEAERLVAFTNASNPLFIIAAVSVGFFQSPTLGILLTVSHYSSNLLVGIVMRFYKANYTSRHRKNAQQNIWKRAFTTLHHTRIKSNKPFGKLFGDAVIHSVQTLLMIGGFIIFFSVFSNILIEVGLADIGSQLIENIFVRFNIPEKLALPFFTGIFEITLGAQQISSYINEPMIAKAILVSLLLAFNGFSVQAQVASILAETDIRYMPYLLGRILQGIFSAGIVIIASPYLMALSPKPIGHAIAVEAPLQSSYLFNQLYQVGPLITLVGLASAFILCALRQLK
ncbi:sporulation integral membrane protein YlbJ [Amphibacillus jilinensis]|uniref:sporulation integral membrane protein YlbJ n=1 Tax=Amphibacillus jilinensis TaxID=1216008 RepID=UPI0002F92BBF|nr:sporulation integral membrane protein YlbJ [Amphibacillus jilinensis]